MVTSAIPTNFTEQREGKITVGMSISPRFLWRDVPPSVPSSGIPHQRDPKEREIPPMSRIHGAEIILTVMALDARGAAIAMRRI